MNGHRRQWTQHQWLQETISGHRRWWKTLTVSIVSSDHLCCISVHMRQWAQLERSQEIMDTILVVTVDNGGHRRQGTLSQEAINTTLGVTARDNGHSNRHRLSGHSYRQWTQCWSQETMDRISVVTGDNGHNVGGHRGRLTQYDSWVVTEDKGHNICVHRRQWTQRWWSQ